MSDFRVIVCGGRGYADDQHVSRVLDESYRSCTAQGLRLVVIEGGADGADAAARHWANQRGVALETYPVSKADWKREGLKAGPMRNALVLKKGADLVIAFPGGSGTDNMVRQARRAHVSVVTP